MASTNKEKKNDWKLSCLFPGGFWETCKMSDKAEEIMDNLINEQIDQSVPIPSTFG